MNSIVIKSLQKVEMHMILGFADKLKMLRKSHNLTQAELSKKLYISPSLVGLYEINERVPSYDVLIRMARLFNVSTDYLLGISNKAVFIDASIWDDEQLDVLLKFIDVFRKSIEK